MQAQPIERTEAHLSDLRLLVHPPNLLQRRGFVLGQLNKTELEKKRRCGRCNKGTRPPLPDVDPCRQIEKEPR